VFGLFKAWKRRRLARRPFPRRWLPILEQRVPFFGQFPDPLRQRFRELLKVFIWDKHFIGAGGMEITDEVRVVIAAAAVRLVLHLDLSLYDRLTEIVVYPSHYRHPDSAGVVFGEAHGWGTVVLSWDAVLHGLRNTRDGLDTATHEFAHVLDRAGGAFDGTPELRRWGDYQPWAEVMSHHFLNMRSRKRRRRVLRSYGATNEAEFFAVATEAFFEQPRKIKRRAPDLYQELSRFYGFDPAGET
jgi:Mlc titration factor MtfA (ptsG expression regulator)